MTSPIVEEKTQKEDDARYPRIGDIVYFYGDGYKEILPAIITHVWSAECVNLHIFVDGSHPGSNAVRTSILHERSTSSDNPRWCFKD